MTAAPSAGKSLATGDATCPSGTAGHRWYDRSDQTRNIALLLGRWLTNQPLLMTGPLLSSLPTVLMLALASRYLIGGITLVFGR